MTHICLWLIHICFNTYLPINKDTRILEDMGGGALVLTTKHYYTAICDDKRASVNVVHIG